MKPTLPRKLVLATETLVRLTPEHLEHVVGGIADIHINLRTCLWNSCKPAR
jgi:hypothetical protein